MLRSRNKVNNLIKRYLSNVLPVYLKIPHLVSTNSVNPVNMKLYTSKNKNEHLSAFINSEAGIM